MSESYYVPQDPRESWPHLVLVDCGGEEYGTAFLVRGRLALSAAHVVGNQRQSIVRHGHRDYKAKVLGTFPGDTALLELIPSGHEAFQSLPTLRLGEANPLPQPFIAWGYGVRFQGERKPVLADGTITGHIEESILQLDARLLLGGMSGGPIAITGDGELTVVGVISAKHAPGGERLGFAGSLRGLPACVREQLGAPVTPNQVARERRLLRRARRSDRVALGGIAAGLLVSGFGLSRLLPPAWAIALITLTLGAVAVATVVAQLARRRVRPAVGQGGTTHGIR